MNTVLFWKKERVYKGFGLNTKKHFGPFTIWRVYKRLDEWDDNEEIGLGFGGKIYLYFGISVSNGFVEFVFRISGISGIGKLQ